MKEILLIGAGGHCLSCIDVIESEKKFKRTGKAGIFAGSLELVKEGDLKIKQDKLFDDIYVKENND